MSAQFVAASWAQAGFAQFEHTLNGGTTAPLHLVRKSAIERFSQQGLPTTANEEWKYTNIAPLAQTRYELAKKGVCSLDEVSPFFSTKSAPRLVFVNGHFDASLSNLDSVPGLTLHSLGQMLKNATSQQQLVNTYLTRYADETNPFVSLNTAFMNDGAVIEVTRGTVLSEAIELLFVSTDTLSTGKVSPDVAKHAVSYPRVLVIGRENCDATLVESYLGLGTFDYLTAPVTEVVLEPGAQIKHYKIGREGKGATHVGVFKAQLASASRLESFTFNLEGRLVRNEVTVELAGEGAFCSMNGLSVSSGAQHVDNHTCLDHAKPNCESHEVFKGIFGDASKGVFSGTIIVRPGAQKTNAIQANNNLLLSNEASVDTRPQLKIWADDVKCTHGATVGELDSDALFYLRSRGVGKEQAKRMLIHAFASDVLTSIHNRDLRSQFEQLLLEKLSTAVTKASVY